MEEGGYMGSVILIDECCGLGFLRMEGVGKGISWIENEKIKRVGRVWRG